MGGPNGLAAGRINWAGPARSGCFCCIRRLESGSFNNLLLILFPLARAREGWRS